MHALGWAASGAASGAAFGFTVSGPFGAMVGAGLGAYAGCLRAEGKTLAGQVSKGSPSGAPAYTFNSTDFVLPTGLPPVPGAPGSCGPGG